MGERECPLCGNRLTPRFSDYLSPIMNGDGERIIVPMVKHWVCTSSLCEGDIIPADQFQRVQDYIAEHRHRKRGLT